MVVANDNRSPAGQLHDGVLDLRLELRTGRWYPENEGGPYRDIYAFAEVGHTPQNSGPLIRVTQGTRIHVALHNALPLAASVYCLHSHAKTTAGALRLAPGETGDLHFTAGDPGTYLYWATTSGKSIQDRTGAETGLSGAIIIDPPGAHADDRVFVVGLWVDPVDQDQIATINGKSWPYTDHLSYHRGETVRWRIINGSFDPHAMHLHGFFFNVDGAGDGERYAPMAGESRRQQVTELVDPGHVFDLSWVPEREGNWLFHCHMTVHMAAPIALHPKDTKHPEHAEQDHSAGMGGLVIGISILPGVKAPPTPESSAATAPRKLQLLITENPDKVPLYQLAVNDPHAPADRNEKKSPSLVGPPIVLKRGEPTEIEVRNLTTSPTAIHWHGIELESYYDGVPGWTGSAQQTTPAIGPASHSWRA